MYCIDCHSINIGLSLIFCLCVCILSRWRHRKCGTQMRRSQYRLFSRLASFPWMCPGGTDTYSKRNQDFVALEPPADDPFLKAFTTDDEPPTVHSMDESQIERNINKYLTMKEDLTPRSAPSTGPGSSIVDIFDFPDEEPERVDPNLARYMNRRNRVVKENHFMYNTVYGTASSSSVFTNGPAPGTCHFQIVKTINFDSSDESADDVTDGLHDRTVPNPSDVGRASFPRMSRRRPTPKAILKKSAADDSQEIHIDAPAKRRRGRRYKWVQMSLQ